MADCRSKPDGRKVHRLRNDIGYDFSSGPRGAFASSLNRAINIVDAEERKKRDEKLKAAKEKKNKPRQYYTRHTDEQVLAIIRRNLVLGTSTNKLAEEHDVCKSQLEKWISGESRGHLRQKVDKEMYEARKKVAAAL